MHFYFPDRKALCMAENATHTLHNLLTLRGALVRDPHAWSGYLTEAIDLFGDDAEVAFASHHWPTWGRDRVVEFLSIQRDLYAYLHDQTLRLLNRGLVGAEIAEQIELPPALEAAWSTHGYYGSVSHNVKAIYQRYMGWYDGNPAHLWQHPPVEAATRYVDVHGRRGRRRGEGAGVVRGRRPALGWPRCSTTWSSPSPTHAAATRAARRHVRAARLRLRERHLAQRLPLRGHRAAERELRDPGRDGSPDMLAQLSPEMLFDALAIRVDGPRAWDERLTIEVRFADDDVRYRLNLANGVLTYSTYPKSEAADLTLTLPGKASLAVLMGGAADPAAFGAAGIEVAGDAGVLDRLLSLLENPDPDFAIVTPTKE